ncbi:MAG: MAPEG family protein [Gammaproteobacteria bacterium]
MTNLQYSPLFLALLAAIAVTLTGVAGVRRGKSGVSLGDGGNPPLQAAMRAQSNFIELTPIAFLLIAGLELSGLASWAVLALGIALIVSRVIHAVTFLSNNGGPGAGRAIGTAGTVFTTVIALVTLLVVTYVG